MVPLFVGALLALAVGLFTSGWGLDRDRALYPVFMMVIAAYYVLFAAMGASTQVLILEVLVAAAFVAAAVLGFRVSLWVAAVALAARSTWFTTESYRTRASPCGGHRSVWPTTLRRRLTWPGCSRQVAFVLVPSSPIALSGALECRVHLTASPMFEALRQRFSTNGGPTSFTTGGSVFRKR